VGRIQPFQGLSSPRISVAEGVSSSRREPFLLPSSRPAVEYRYRYPQAIAEHLGRDACNMGHVRPDSDKLELLHLGKWNENETYDEEASTCFHYPIKW
jgi:hypothetical protein